MEKSTKLAINLTEGTVQVEGDEAFVRSIYEDFKESLGKQIVHRAPVVTVTPSAPAPPAQITDQSARHKRRPGRKSARTEGNKPRTSEYKPKFRGDLDLKDLEAAYEAFAPKNHPEKILLFATFLRDTLQISPCTGDDIFTCYGTMKAKTEKPEAFVQAFRDCQNKAHYIEFKSPQDIQITIPGDNFYNKRSQQSKGAGK